MGLRLNDSSKPAMRKPGIQERMRIIVRSFVASFTLPGFLLSLLLNWVLLYQDSLAQLWGRGKKYDDPRSPSYLPPEEGHITEKAQTGYAPWPALPKLLKNVEPAVPVDSEATSGTALPGPCHATAVNRDPGPEPLRRGAWGCAGTRRSSAG